MLSVLTPAGFFGEGGKGWRGISLLERGAYQISGSPEWGRELIREGAAY